MIVLDASVLIAYLDAEHVHHSDAETLLLDAADDEFGANSLTMAEVLVVPARTGRLPETLRALDDLEVRELPFPHDVALRLADLRATTGLKMPDCCVLLAAEDATASIATFDSRLKRGAADRGIPIME